MDGLIAAMVFGEIQSLIGFADKILLLIGIVGQGANAQGNVNIELVSVMVEFLLANFGSEAVGQHKTAASIGLRDNDGEFLATDATHPICCPRQFHKNP